jgi:hypothetical protein
VGSRAGLDATEKRNFYTLPGLEFRSLGRPARSQSLYRLRYPGSELYGNIFECKTSSVVAYNKIDVSDLSTLVMTTSSELSYQYNFFKLLFCYSECI